MNSANARTCYVCVSPLAPPASAASAAPATGRRYASFPDEVATGAEVEMDTGALLARDLLQSLQKKSKPRRAPLPQAVEVPVTQQPDMGSGVAVLAAPAAILSEPAPAAVSFREEILAPASATAVEPVALESVAAAPAKAKAEEPELKAEWDWTLPPSESAPAAPIEEFHADPLAVLTSAVLDEVRTQAESLLQTPASAPLESELEPVGVVATGKSATQNAAGSLGSLARVTESARGISSPEETAAPARSAGPRSAAKPTVIASEDWRRELTSRVDAYRARGGNTTEDEPQSGLQFSAQETEPAAGDDSILADIPAEETSPRASLRTAARRRPEAVEIVALQPEFDFASGETDEHPHAPLVPVAELSDRRAAGLLDAAFLVAAYLTFLVCFTSLGPGKITFGKMEFAILGAAFFLFYVQYFGLFTIFGGASPGMMIRGLRVVRFDGSAPDAQQLMRRSFGYVLSAASLLLGFLWSLWDEDQLTWHDRMSHTYLTHAAPQHSAENTAGVTRS